MINIPVLFLRRWLKKIILSKLQQPCRFRPINIPRLMKKGKVNGAIVGLIYLGAICITRGSTVINASALRKKLLVKQCSCKKLTSAPAFVSN